MHISLKGIFVGLFMQNCALITKKLTTLDYKEDQKVV